uniref:Uncharacterized protein n=1 Tax=Rhizophora mucronata TaxID=61149 RepID=A0A2P2QME4_RHIMU
MNSMRMHISSFTFLCSV